MSREDERGQAAVETAIVAPLFIFTMMGLIQFTLLYQARALLKYAAFRAARAGAMMNACPDPMRTAALNVLLPVIALKDAYNQTKDAGSYATALIKTKMMNRYWDAWNVKIMDITICGPLQSWVSGGNAYHPGDDQSQEVDFDDPYNTPGTLLDGDPISVAGGNGATLKGFERTRLRIQLRLNQKLIIPLANWVIFRAWMGMGTNKLIRMGDKNDWGFRGASKNKRLKYDLGYKNDVRWKSSSDVVKSNTNQLWIAALFFKRYFIPLYANYGFRMQSNYYLQDCPLPETNQCFHYKSDDTGP